MATTTIDRETRDVIVDFVRSYETGQFEAFHETLRLGSRDEVASELDQIDWIRGLLDVTGWDCEGDADEYEVNVDERLVKFVVGWHDDHQDSLEHDIANLEHVRQGDEDYYAVGYSQAETARVVEELVAKERREVEILGRLRDRFTPSEAVV